MMPSNPMVDKEYVATIAGHYLFNHQDVQEMKHVLNRKLLKPIDTTLVEYLEKIIEGHLMALGWIK
jgi:hypothetical protein